MTAVRGETSESMCPVGAVYRGGFCFRLTVALGQSTTDRIHREQFWPVQVDHLRLQSAVSADPSAHVGRIARPEYLVARAADHITSGRGIPCGVKYKGCPRCDTNPVPRNGAQYHRACRRAGTI